LLEAQIGQIKTAAVFVGKDGVGPWQQIELETFLREFVDRKCPVIPVVLADAPDKPELPCFLRGMTWVDFRKKDPDPMERLVWGITGRNPNDGDTSGSQGIVGNVADNPSPSTPSNVKPDQSLVQMKRGELQARYKRLSEKIAYLEKEYDDAMNAGVRFELSKQIEKEKAERDKVEAELRQLQ
jgi:hypothetical protein